jgi:UDP-N-acetylenolpyruvoylglucosamine reductase
MHISFREPDSFSEVKLLADFLWKQDLGYPNYSDWVLRARNEIDLGYKKSIIAFDESRIVGNVVFQKHKEIPEIREIKNLRVSIDLRFRKFGSFLLKQAEWFESSNYSLLMADFRETEKWIGSFLIKEGFQVIRSASLYDDKIDSIAVKKNCFKSQNVNFETL